MSEVVRVGVLGIVGALLAVQFKTQKPEYSIYISFAVSILIFFYAVQQVGIVLQQFELIKRYLDGSQAYIGTLIKVVGITYICEFSAGICKDAGFGTVSNQIEILGKLAVVFAGLPILFTVIEQIQGLMG